MKPLTVLSLFDGCSGGQQALERASIPVKTYYASEIDKFAIKVTMAAVNSASLSESEQDGVGVGVGVGAITESFPFDTVGFDLELQFWKTKRMGIILNTNKF